MAFYVETYQNNLGKKQYDLNIKWTEKLKEILLKE